MKSSLMRCMLVIACFLFAATAWSQIQKISGKVTSDEDNTPLSGVNVTIKGKPGGTQTNSNGEFSIDAAQGDVLVFSFTGFATQEVTVGTSSNVSLSMKTEASNLGEVVVVGYGTQSRRNITSSIGKLDNAVLKNAPRANVGTALQGSIAGIRVVNN